MPALTVIGSFVFHVKVLIFCEVSWAVNLFLVAWY